MSVIVKLLSKFDDSGIKKAQHGFGGLKKVLGGIAIGAALKQVGDVLLDAAKAASADAKSTKLLNTQLVRNAHATKDQIKQSDKFIEKLSLQTGIFDDDLRPAYGKFARVTKDVHKAQGLLTLALDTSATTGKPLEKVSNAISQAFIGNKTQLLKLFPALKTSTDLFGDLEKIVGGAAIQQADPFNKFNNSMDILKEKLGNLVLPMIADFVTELTKPGGIVETVGKFLTDLANPKTEPGKMFLQIKDAVKQTFQGVKDFFALFGNGDAMKGFANVASALVTMLPALLAIKGIMFLASAANSIKNLAIAIGLIQGKGVTGGMPIAGTTAAAGKGASLFGKLTTLPVIGTVAAVLSTSGDSRLPTPAEAAIINSRRTGINPATGLPYAGALGSGVFANGKGFAPNQTNHITINVQGADPKATVDALGKYVKNNGSLPTNLFPNLKPTK
jgi:hypothetical protein